jgi:polyvinyl alcohol dehydrogenase (cytochrome)
MFRQPTCLNRAAVVAVVLAAAWAACLTAAAPNSSAQPADRSAAASLAAVPTDWPAYERGPGHSSANFDDAAITAANAGSLTPAWHFVADAATQSGQPARRFDASPTVASDTVFIGSRTGMFYALDADTGALRWKKQLDYGSSATCSAKGIVGTAAVAADPVSGALTVYAAGAHILYALNAADGTQLWRRAIGPNTATGNALYFNWSSPTVYGGRVFMGLGANCDATKIRGGEVAINQHTGALQHTWYDAPAGEVGATVWSSAAAQGSRVWVTTGSPDPNGPSIFDAYSIVRLAAGTMAKLDQWMAPNAIDSDLDFGSSPTLFTATMGGTSTPLVGACNKNGIFYTWQRANLAAGPVWSRRVGAVGGAGGGAIGDCITSAAWDSQLSRLYVAANNTTIGGTAFPGGLRALNPATGAVIWERGLPCIPTGSPTINGSIVAVPMYTCPAGVSPSVLFFRKSDGAPAGSVPATGPTFAQPVFANGMVYVASADGTLTAYGP